MKRFTRSALGVICILSMPGLSVLADGATSSTQATASFADSLPIMAFVSAFVITLLTLFGGMTIRTPLPVIASVSGMIVTALLGLLIWTPILATPGLQAVMILALCALACEISLALSATPYPNSVRRTLRTIQLCALGLGLLLLLARETPELAAWSITLSALAFTLMGANALYLGVTRQRFTLYIGLSWFAMGAAAMSIGRIPASTLGNTTQLLNNPQTIYALILFAGATLLMALGLMHKTMRSHAAWAKELAASKRTDRMLRLEQSQRAFSQEVEHFLDSILPSDFEEVVLASFLSHLDRVIDVAASAVVVSHRGQMRLVSRFPQGSDAHFSAVLTTRENLLQSVCLSDKAAILHSEDHGLHVDNEPLSTLCVLPVHSPRNEWSGVVLARPASQEFTFDELHLVKQFAEHVRSAFASAHKFNRIRRQAETDTLTGLMNRGAITARAERAFKKARSLKQDLSFLFIDIDNFKQVNDTHGHEAGDQALFHVAQLCQVSLRDDDKVGRFGGEEFIAVLPGTAEEYAHLAAERIRKSIAESPLSVEGALLELTVSVGISEISPHFVSTQDMLNAADRALYAAKRDGRNRVVHHLRIVGGRDET